MELTGRQYIILEEIQGMSSKKLVEEYALANIDYGRAAQYATEEFVFRVETLKEELLSRCEHRISRG